MNTNISVHIKLFFFTRPQLNLVFVGFFLICPLLYSLYDSFWYIDDKLLVDIPQLRGPFSTQILKTIFTPGNHVDFYPIRDLSYLIENIVLHADYFGGNGIIYRADNLIFLMITYCMLYRIIYYFSEGHFIAFLISTIWLYNPFHLETILWISARKDILALMFFSVLINAVLNKNHLLVVVSFGLCLLSKASFIFLPFVGLCYLICNKKSVDKQAIAVLICCFAMSLLSGILQVWQYTNINDMTYSYNFAYRVQSVFIALGKCVIGLFMSKYNVLDIRNGGNWLEINYHFIWVGIIVTIIFVSAFVYLFYKKKYGQLFFLYLLFFIYLAVPGVLFKHRIFYSVRYFEPIFFSAVMYVGYLCANWNCRIKLKFLTGMLILSVINWYLSIDVHSSSLKYAEKGVNSFPENLALKTFYLMELKRVDGWGKLTIVQKKIMVDIEVALNLACIENQRLESNSVNRLCLDFLKYAEVSEGYSQVKSNIIRMLKIIEKDDQNEYRKQWQDYYKKAVTLDENPTIKANIIKLSTDNYFANKNETERLYVWRYICLRGDYIQARDFMQKKKEIFLLDDIGIKIFMSDITKENFNIDENKVLAQCL